MGAITSSNPVWFFDYRNGIPIIDYMSHIRAENVTMFLLSMMSLIIFVCWIDQRKENERAT